MPKTVWRKCRPYFSPCLFVLVACVIQLTCCSLWSHQQSKPQYDPQFVKEMETFSGELLYYDQENNTYYFDGKQSDENKVDENYEPPNIGTTILYTDDRITVFTTGLSYMTQNILVDVAIQNFSDDKVAVNFSRCWVNGEKIQQCFGTKISVGPNEERQNSLILPAKSFSPDAIESIKIETTATPSSSENATQTVEVSVF